METEGIQGLLVETHNWGKAVAFWQGLGYQLEFETDHHSGQLRHPRGGPFLFIAERPPHQPLKLVPMIAVTEAARFSPPSAGTVLRPFEPQHWQALEMLLADPDGRELSVQAPLPPASGQGAAGASPAAEPDSTAVRVALWRALHVEIDPPPHVFEDVIGLRLAAPGEGWQGRPDMSPFTRPFRASIIARARFIEDLVAERDAAGVGQYVLLGAGLDTFVQRRPELASRLAVFEVDQPGPQAWKHRRLVELGLGVPPYLRLVPVDFEAGDAWWERLAGAGFDARRPAVVASTGVSMYLTREAIAATLRQIAALAPGSTLVMSFLVPIELADPEVRPGLERAAAGARASGTPFVSFFTPAEMLALAREAGFRTVEHVSASELAARYFAGRTDGLRPPANTEELLVATT
jgi:methyltransferase (TIGR00027 family)